MPDPREPIARERDPQKKARVSADESHEEERDHQGSTDEVKRAAYGIAVFAEIVRIKLRERLEFRNGIRFQIAA